MLDYYAARGAEECVGRERVPVRRGVGRRGGSHCLLKNVLTFCNAIDDSFLLRSCDPCWASTALGCCY